MNANETLEKIELMVRKQEDETIRRFENELIERFGLIVLKNKKI